MNDKKKQKKLHKERHLAACRNALEAATRHYGQLPCSLAVKNRFVVLCHISEFCDRGGVPLVDSPIIREVKEICIMKRSCTDRESNPDTFSMNLLCSRVL